MIAQKYFCVYEVSQAARGFTLLKMRVRKYLEQQKETEKDMFSMTTALFLSEVNLWAADC